MKIKNLSFKYGNDIIIDNISFEVKKGEMLGIVGESGAGKSTLLRLLGNLISIQEGQIINNEEVGVIFQNFNLFPHLNVIDNLTLSLRVNKKLSLDKINNMADKLLDDFKIKK